jgi:mannose-6-phosphate isomerase-like protein (cupin superfamily)
MKVANLKKKLASFSDLWAPRIVAQMNDYHFKLVKIRGEFIWHSHPETDETFFIIDGEMVMELRDRSIPLYEGDLMVVPRGVEHRPVAASECHIMLIEPAGTVNTGDAGGPLTAEDGVWV